MTRTLKTILAAGAAASLVLAAAYSFLSRAQRASEEKFDWQTIMDAADRGGYDAGVAVLEARLAAHPNDALLHYYRARLYYDAGDAAASEREADRAISLGYAQEISHVLKGLARGRLRGDYAAQKALASKALTYDPTYDFAYLARAEAEHALGEYKACAADAAAYSGLRPKDKDGYEYSMLCLERLGDYAAAEAAGLTILRLDPRAHAAMWRLGRLYAAQGLHKRALKRFNEAIKASGGGRPKYFADKAASCAAEGDFSCEAWAYYDAMAWQEVSGYASYYYLLGSALYRSGDLKPGLDAAESAVRLDPRGAANYGLRGRLRAESGQRAGALADFAKMAELEPSRSAEAGALAARLRASGGRVPSRRD
jgi:tetratricopeptide (TPR) repeat protein